ncbi:MAG: winged helix DNA-binding protein [Pseudolysinimonas sp.]
MRSSERIRYLVLALQREGNRSLAAALRPLNLTPSQSEVLRILGDAGPLSLTEVGRLLVCEAGTNPSRLVDKLVRADLVDRREDATDRRLVELTLTARGREMEQAVRQIEEAMYSQIEAGLAGADAESIAAILERMAAGSPSGDALQARIALT